MDGYEVKRLETVVNNADIVITATGNKDILKEEHFRAMRDKAIVCNIGHFDELMQYRVEYYPNIVYCHIHYLFALYLYQFPYHQIHYHHCSKRKYFDRYCTYFFMLHWHC